MTPTEAAAWMATQVRASGYLDHAEVIDHLSGTLGLVEENEAGNPVVAKSVLTAFRKAEIPDIVWSRSGQHWRLREDDDPPGRLAD